nr:hypothetical protein [Tanacetum cinerariifolium]
MTYKEPPIPPPGVEEQEPTEETTDTELPSTEDIQPPSVQVEEERIRREHADYINRMEMLFTINPRPHNPMNDNTNVESFSSFPIPIQESDFHQEEIDVVSITDDVLPLSVDNVDSDEKVDAVDVLHVDNFIQNSKHEYSESEDSDFDNPLIPLPPPKPPDKGFDFEIDFKDEFSVVRSVIVKIECIDVFNDENDVLSYFMFDKGFSLLSAKRGIDFESEEIENFLNDDSIPFGVEDSPFNMDEDILFLESLLREDLSPQYPIIPNQTKLPIKEPNHSFNMGYEHFNTNLVTNEVAESSTKNLIPIPHECEFDNLDEFYGPFIPIHILEEERIKREHADYINRMEMLFTINPRPHNPTNDNTNVESFSSLLIPIQESDSHQEEIDVVAITDDVLPLSVDNDDSDEEVDVVDILHVDNFIQNSEHEYSENEDSDFDNPPVPLPPPEPPDKGFKFEKEISVERSVIVKFECIDAKVKFDVFNDENDVLAYFMFDIFAKEFSLLFAESEDTIFDPGISD